MNGCRIVYYCELTESDDEKDCEFYVVAEDSKCEYFDYGTGESYVEVEDGRCEFCDYNTGECNSEEARYDTTRLK